MEIIPQNNQHEYRVGRFYLTISKEDVTLHDTTDHQRCVMTEEMTTEEMIDIAQALYVGAKLREKATELLNDELMFDAQQELQEMGEHANSL